MAATKITATKRDIDRSVDVTYDFGSDLTEMVELFGPEVVYNRAAACIVIDVQAKVRTLMVDSVDKDGKIIRAALSDEEIQAALDEWKPGVRNIQRKSAKEKLREALAAMPAEERAALLAELVGEDEDEYDEEEVA